MTNTTKKLAGTFLARRFKVGVMAEHFVGVYRHLDDLGLQPKSSGLGVGNIRGDIPSQPKFMIILSVAVPCDIGDKESHKSWDVLKNGLKPFKATVTVQEGEIVELICPPEMEKCIIGAMEGMCPHCRGYHKVIGPVYYPGSEKKVYIMVAHSIRGSSEPGLCPGSGSERIEESAT